MRKRNVILSATTSILTVAAIVVGVAAFTDAWASACTVQCDNNLTVCDNNVIAQYSACMAEACPQGGDPYYCTTQSVICDAQQSSGLSVCFSSWTACINECANPGGDGSGGSDDPGGDPDPIFRQKGRL